MAPNSTLVGDGKTCLLMTVAYLGVESGVLFGSFGEAVVQRIQALLQDQHLLIELPLPGQAHIPDAVQGCLHPTLQRRPIELKIL